MHKLNKDYLNVSMIIAIVATVLVPSNPEQGNILLRYKYGFPFSYITILQRVPTSKWFGANFFTGNMGLAINPLTFLINIFVLYFIILHSVKIFSKNS
ncbi:hypothetical protein SAMN05446037_1001413 [Anaerovirgula multivorans]|uniref:Uncharacterized protein n=1 Tax=Anaerovirgula multivorans TaxID=312168 RepID=A0A239AAB4_9FIRM|nr:hypothetical protein [Anaerovirgula multivorans]SNR91823.1 hypothetical protein SAMN05446037_1001413 [Anaerovirgula multivorans]